MRKYVLLGMALLMMSFASASVDVDAKTNGWYTIVDGTIQENGANVGQSKLVKVYCRDTSDDEHYMGDTETDMNGHYILGKYFSGCEVDGEAWVIVTLDSGDHKSPEVKVTSGTLGSGFTYRYANVNANVPEFSTIGVGLAVFGGALGFAFLRKRK